VTPRYCTRCVLPDTRPGVSIDVSGVCSGCRNAETKRTINWAARAREFADEVERARSAGGPYDCVIPVSGGKDSYWQVVTCLEHGLHPLCVTYVYPERSALGERNLRQLVALGVDHIELRVNPYIERAFIKKAFLATATSGLVSHMAIYAWPLQVALAYGIPLVVYGENSAFEFGTDDESLIGARVDRRWLDRFGVTGGTTAADWVDDELTAASLRPFFLPTDEDLTAHDVRVVFLGHYFPWDPEHSLAVARRAGFEARAEGPRVGHYDYVNIDDDMIGVHHHAKWYKFGITRSWDTVSMEIRAGRMSRDEAINLLRERGAETPLPDIDVFCKYLGISYAEYDATLERFRNRDLWSRRDGTWKIDGFLIPDFSWPDPPAQHG
jgi:N-acetyl sugar amidotransferase